MNWHRVVADKTDLLRNGDDPMHLRIRRLLGERGIDLQNALVANFMPEDQYMSSGIVVTPGGSVYEFEFAYRGGPVEEGTFSAWRDLTDTYASHPRAPSIAAARAMLQRDRVHA
jgi:hypothetical protein